MLRPGSAGANTTADHLQILGEAITAVPAKYRRRLMVTCDGAGASHGLITRLDELASGRAKSSPIPSAGAWAPGNGRRSPPSRRSLADRRRPARPSPGPARRRELHGSFLHPCAVLARGGARRRADRAAARGPGRGPAGGLARRDAGSSPAGNARIPARNCPCSRKPMGGVTASGWPTARTVRGSRPSWPYGRRPPRMPRRGPGSAPETAGWAASPPKALDREIAPGSPHSSPPLLAWLQLLALDGDLAKAEPKTLRYRILHTAGRLTRGQRRRQPGHPRHLALGPPPSPPPGPGSRPSRTHLTPRQPSPRPRGTQGPVEPPATRAASRACCHTPTIKSRSTTRRRRPSRTATRQHESQG